MGRMKELFMEMQQRELQEMPLTEFLAMIRNERMMQESEPNPEDELGDEYWQEKANIQDEYEKDLENELKKEAELPENKKVLPCSSDESKKDKDLEDFDASNTSNTNTIHILDDIVIINKETVKENFTNKETNNDTETVKENCTDKENETETDKNKLIFPIVIDEMYCK